MKKSAYRLQIFKAFVVVVLTFPLLFLSCDENEHIERPDPTIRLIKGENYITADTTIGVGKKYTVAIRAEYNGYHKLTNFIAILNGERYMDLGIYKDIFIREIEISKGLQDVDEWEFIIRDIEGHSASTFLTIYKDQNIVYGDIDEFSDVRLGAQNSTEYGSFLSLSDGSVYHLEEAYNNSALVDIVYYYDNFDKLDENILASPGANIGESAFPGEFAISNWETVNTTRYAPSLLNVTPQEFDAAKNDSILIAHSFAFESGKRKAKYLSPGDVYSFVRGSRTGMFKVVSVEGEARGNIIIDIKIQK